MRGKDLLRRGAIPLEQRYYGNARLFRDDELGFLRTRDPDQSHVTVTRELYHRTRAAGYDDVTAMQYVDLFTWLRGDILVKADKMTMANSLELRVPFLDSEVFKVAGTLPVDQRVTKETTKYALRRALEQIVPAHVLNRRKLGFPVPTRYWLAEPLHDWARQIIEDSQTDEWLDKQQVLAMLAAHRTNQRSGSAVDYSRKLWTLLVFMIWHGIFVEERITPAVPETVYPGPLALTAFEPLEARNRHVDVRASTVVRTLAERAGAQWNESPQAQEPPALGLSIVKPCFSMVSTKSMVAPPRYGPLIRSTITSTPPNS